MQRKIKKDKIQRWWNLTQGNLFTISRLKMQHWRGWFEGSQTFFWNRGLATILAVLPHDEHSRSLCRNSGPIFLLRYVSVLFFYWTRSHSHHRECYQHGYYFFRFGCLETRSCCLLNIIWWSLNVLSSFAISATVSVALWRLSKPIWNIISCNRPISIF